MSANQETVPNQGVVQVACQADDGFRNWMSSYGGSVIFSTLNSNRVVVLGWDGRQVSVLMREFNRPSGISVLKNQIVIVTRHELNLFADAPLLAYDYRPDRPGDYDACYLPRATWHVGDIGARDVATDRSGIVFSSTRFSCLARPSFRYHFEVEWQPPFVTELTPEDRCHVSGFVPVNGAVKYVTAFGAENVLKGWRGKPTGGVLVDAESGEIVLNGLNFPHSPRWHRECLWFLNSGEGALCVMNPLSGELKTVCRVPGFARGLTFYENYAMIGLSRVRKNHENDGIFLRNMNNEPCCGVAVVSILTGKLEGLFRFDAGCDEVYEVCTLPGVHHAALVTLDKSACYEAITTEKLSWWVREQREVGSNGQA